MYKVTSYFDLVAGANVVVEKNENTGELGVKIESLKMLAVDWVTLRKKVDELLEKIGYIPANVICPYPKYIIDECSGESIPNKEYHIWWEGYLYRR